MIMDVMGVQEVSPGYEFVAENPAVPVGYKQTEVGVIPEDWDAISLDSISRVTSGKRLPAGYFVTSDITPHPYIRVSDMYQGGVEPKLIKYVPTGAFPAISQYRIFVGDLFISVAGTLGLVGKIPESLDGANLTENANRISDIQCYQDYLLYVLLSDLVQNTIESIRTVGAQPKLALARIRKFQIPLPPTLEEQRAIATALSDVDALLEELDCLIAKKRDIKQAAMQQLLTGETRLPGFEGEWEQLSIRQVITQSATYGIVTAGTFVLDGVKMLRGGDISDGNVNTRLPMVTHAKAAEYSRTALLENDVVIALVGYPGASAKVPTELIGSNISRAVGLLRPNGKILADFLVQVLNSPAGRKMVLAPSAGSAQQVVNLSALNKLRLSVPPIAEQKAITAILSDIDAEIQALEQRRSKTAELKQGMMQELLTGRTRLV